QLAVAPADRLALERGGERERHEQLVVAPRSAREGHLPGDLTLHALLLGGPEPIVGLEARDVRERMSRGIVRSLDGAHLYLEEAHRAREPRMLAGQRETLGLHPPLLAASAVTPETRRQHAELPPHAVLLRRRTIGVQDVSLVQHGVGHGAGPREAHAASSPARRKSAPITSSQLASAWRAL